MRIGNKTYSIVGSSMRDVEVKLIVNPKRPDVGHKVDALFYVTNAGRIEEALIAAKESYRAA